MGDHSQFENIRPLFAPIIKIDEAQRMVFGYASTETRDHQKEVIRRSAIQAALPSYMQFANIREMHQPSAVGTAEEAEMDDTGLWLGAKVVDDRAWQKVMAKVYKGFSIGGRVTSRDPDDRSIITGIDLTEISLVDRPANPDATFQVIKREGESESDEFTLYKRAAGELLPQPMQKWDCGDATHQHMTKLEASTCMAKAFGELGKETVVVQRVTAKGTVTVEKTQPNLASGKFGTHAAAAQESDATATDHEARASDARRDQRKHALRATRAQDKGDAQGVAIHQNLAGAAAALATHHDAAAEQHRQLAARHRAASKQSTTMEKSAMANAVEDAQKAASDATAAMNALVGGTVDAAEADAARKAALSHDAAATASLALATAARIAVAKATGAEAANLLADAQEHELATARYCKLADGYYSLFLHHLDPTQVTKANIQTILTAQTAMVATVVALAKSHELAQTAAKAQKDEPGEKHHASLAKMFGEIHTAREALVKALDPSKSPDVVEKTETVEKDDMAECAGCKTMNPKGAEKCSKCDKAMKVVAADTMKAATMDCPKCGAAMPKDNEKCQNCGAALHKAVKTADEATARKAAALAGIKEAHAAVFKTTEQRTKGMGIVAELARLLESVRYLQESSAMEQFYEGDTDDPTPGKLKGLLSEIASVLVAVVANETSELMSGDDVDTIAAGVFDGVPLLRVTAPLCSLHDVVKAIVVAKGDKAPANLAGLLTKLEPLAQKADDKAAKNVELLKTARDEAAAATGALTSVTAALKGFAADMARVQKRLTSQEAVIATLKSQLTALADTPMPARARGILVTMTKADDVGNEGDSLRKDVLSFSERAMAILDPVARNEFMLRNGYVGQGHR